MTRRCSRRCMRVHLCCQRALAEALEARMLLASQAYHWPVAPDELVNTYTFASQTESAIAMDEGGDFVVVWSGSGPTDYDGIYAQRYNAAGTQQGTQFRVNTHATERQNAPAVAMDGDGDFIIVWTSRGQDGSEEGIYAQRYSAAGVPQDSEFRVNTYTTSRQENPSLAVDDNGNFVVAWQSSGQDGSGYGVYAQRFNSQGAAEGTEFRVNANTAGSQQFPSAAMDSDGDFIVAWESVDASDFQIHAQRYDADGSALGIPFVVNSHTSGSQTSPQAAMDALGNFVIAWTSAGQDGSDSGVYGQRYAAAGLPAGTEFRVNSYTTGAQSIGSVAMNSDADFIVAWRSYLQDGSQGGAYAQRYDAAAAPLGTEFRVNTYTTGSQSAGFVAMDDAGNFVVTWNRAGPGDQIGIFAHRYISFGEGIAALVGGRTWNDADADGIQDLAEPGFAGAAVEFYSADGSQVGSTISDEMGNYHFPALAGASAFLRFFTVPDFIFTLRDRGADDELDSDPDRITGLVPSFMIGSAGSSNDSFDAGLVAASSVTGIVFFDRNGDGIRNGGEEGIAGFQVFEDLDADGLLDHPDEPAAASRNDGSYQIDGVLGGTYVIAPGDQDLWMEPAVGAISIPVGDSIVLDLPIRTTVHDTASSPRGGEFLVNSYIDHDQTRPRVAMATGGDFVVTWQSDVEDGSLLGIFAQRYNAAGQRQGNEFQVNTYTTDRQHVPSIAIDADGDFVIAWQSFGQDGSNNGIYAQRFSAAGVRQGTEFRVNTYTPDFQRSPSVAMDAAGDFVITWEGSGQDGSNDGVFARRYNAAGVAQGPEFQVNTYTIGYQNHPSAAMDADGNFVIIWQSTSDGRFEGLYGQRYDAAGVAQGNEFRINTLTTDAPRLSAVAMDAAGNFVVTWHGLVQRGSFESIYEINAQRYNAAGVPQGTAVRVLSYATAKSFFIQPASPAMAGNGDFIVSWFGQTQNDYGIYTQQYNAAGVPQAALFRAGNAGPTAAAMDADGDFIVAWHTYGQDGGGYGVYAQLYTVAVRPAVTSAQFIWQDSSQRLEFTFDQDVSQSLSSADLLLQNLTTMMPVPPSDIVTSWDAATLTASFSFPLLPLGGSLPDGNYRALLLSAGVSNPGGISIATDYSVDFFFLQADANHDRIVDMTDFDILAANFGLSERNFTHGDFNYDGRVNLIDFNILAGRFGNILGPQTFSAARIGEVHNRPRVIDTLRDEMFG